MESSSTTTLTLDLDQVRDHERCSVPPLCEIWNWEGDKSILPIKWSETLKSTFGIDIDHKFLKETYADNPQFDPNGFFFVTYRSNTIGNCLVFPDEDGKYWIQFLTADQAYRDKQLEEALIGLAIEYMNSHKSDIKTLYIHPFDQDQQDVLTSMGFTE
ncbi:unnamed protein product [Moneuplotes crassus]|uniref:Uncharacterized protein n=1 Tax=Euplotes crassus TaxID=5936 RepID=A0AAD2D8H4_EUPCR|nr:unnamed protein product [Moneuplotes crassus]